MLSLKFAGLILLASALRSWASISKIDRKPISWSVEYPPSSPLSKTTEAFQGTGSLVSPLVGDFEQHIAGTTPLPLPAQISAKASENSSLLEESLRASGVWAPEAPLMVVQAGELAALNQLVELGQPLANRTSPPAWTAGSLGEQTGQPLSSLQLQLLNDFLLSPASLAGRQRALEQLLAGGRSLQQQPARRAQQVAARSAWLKPLGSRRRSYEPLLLNDAHLSKMVKFDDALELDSFKAPKEILSAKLYEPPSTGLPDRDRLSLLVDNLLAGSRYSEIVQATPSYFHANYYAPAAHKHSASSRKGLDKSPGGPILIGVAAALISFLILSNLFLSIPLLAMTLMQFLNGNNMLMPNNNPNNNNNSNNGLANGRRKRDLQLERRVQEALRNVSSSL